MIRKYPNGLTISELKQIVADMPDIQTWSGDPYEVWIDTGNGLSSVCTVVSDLNAGDLLFEVR